ncbi:MAG: phage tail protein [Polynucleobacter sp.]
MAYGDFSQITYVDSANPLVPPVGGGPAINATNLNPLEAKVKELDSLAATPTADTIAERTGGAGVTIDSLLIKDGNIGQGGGVGLCPVGSMLPYAGAAAPNGWFLCDGTAKSRTTYAALFTAIGETWGVGDSSTTFNLPDLREASLVGAGTYSAVAGTTHGTLTAHDAVALAAFADDREQEHIHELQCDNASYIDANKRLLTAVAAAGSTTGVFRNTNGNTTAGWVAVGATRTDGVNGTPRTGATTRGKIIGVNIIIKY